MITKSDLMELMDLSNRHVLFEKLLLTLKGFASLDKINYYEYTTSEGKIPIVIIADSPNDFDIKYVKLFVGAQHNEYNGLFGMIEVLNQFKDLILSGGKIFNNHQIMIFAPLMNPFGFLNPRLDNKSGYFIKNGTNLNRYWRRTFAPDFENGDEDLKNLPIPEHAKIIKDLLNRFWGSEEAQIYIIDFHETSLIERFSSELNENLKRESVTYKFNHWLKEGIVYNVIKLYNIKFTRKPLFYKCTPQADHTHINMTIKQLEEVCEKLQEYIFMNEGKLPFYFCYSNRSKEFCERLAHNVYNKMKPILWETYFPAFNHSFNNHGCFVNMNDAIERKGLYSIELETPKQFFNIFDEIEKSKSDMNYFENKIRAMNMSIKLVVESIKEMLTLY
ncbi:MAG: hypothetical protein ACFFDB_07175 [Promethearchaeota archaeon]